MTFDQIFSVVVAGAGIMLSLAYYPQVFRMWKAKSAEGVSVPSYVMFALGTAIWLSYGVYKSDWLIISGFFFGVVGSWLVLFLTLYYRNHKGS